MVNCKNKRGQITLDNNGFPVNPAPADNPPLSPASPSDAGKPKIWLFILIPLAVIIIAGIVIYFVLNSSNANTEILSKENPNVSGNVNLKNETLGAVEIINCGSTVTGATSYNSSFECFINASENCNQAEFLLTNTLNLFGVITTATGRLELRGMENGKCLFYQKTNSISMIFSNETVQQMLTLGTNQSEINRLQEEMNTMAQQEMIGFEQTCKFDTTELHSMLAKWKVGNYHGGASCQLLANQTANCTYAGDLENASCTASFNNSA
jgi:hypothetical protein